MLRELKLMVKLVLLGIWIGRTYAAWEQRFQPNRLK
jgi:hypothetical protein